MIYARNSSNGHHCSLASKTLHLHRHFRHQVIIDNHQDLYQTHSGSLKHGNLIGLFFSIHSGRFSFTRCFTQYFHPGLSKYFEPCTPTRFLQGFHYYGTKELAFRPVQPYKISTAILVLKSTKVFMH